MKKLAVLFIVAVLAVGIQAGNVPLINGGFEEPVVEWEYADGTPPPGWTLTQGQFWGGVDNNGWQTEGLQVGWMQTNNNLVDGYTSQTLQQLTSYAAVEGKQYILSYDVTCRWGWAPLKELTGSILLDGVAVSSFTANYVPAGEGWITYSTPAFTATAADAGKLLGVQFYTDNLDNEWYSWTYFDNIQLTEVPEPATMIILGIGAALLRRRK